jgi:hypothetical protein
MENSHFRLWISSVLEKYWNHFIEKKLHFMENQALVADNLNKSAKCWHHNGSALDAAEKVVHTAFEKH